MQRKVAFIKLTVSGVVTESLRLTTSMKSFVRNNWRCFSTLARIINNTGTYFELPGFLNKKVSLLQYIGFNYIF